MIGGDGKEDKEVVIRVEEMEESKERKDRSKN
jgi:hypothetical protein